MSKVQKEIYAAPATSVFEVRQKGVICASPEIRGGNSIKGWNNGGTTNDEVYM